MSEFNKYLEIIQEQKYNQNYNYDEGLLSRKIKHAATKIGKKISNYLPYNDDESILGKIGGALYKPHFLQGINQYDIINHVLNLTSGNLTHSQKLYDRNLKQIDNDKLLTALAVKTDDQKNKEIEKRINRISSVLFDKEFDINFLTKFKFIQLPEDDDTKYFLKTFLMDKHVSLFYFRRLSIDRERGNKNKYLEVDNKLYRKRFGLTDENSVTVKETRSIIGKLIDDFYSRTDKVLTNLENFIKKITDNIILKIKKINRFLIVNKDDKKLVKYFKDLLGDYRFERAVETFVIGRNRELTEIDKNKKTDEFDKNNKTEKEKEDDFKKYFRAVVQNSIITFNNLNEKYRPSDREVKSNSRDMEYRKYDDEGKKKNPVVEIKKEDNSKLNSFFIKYSDETGFKITTTNDNELKVFTGFNQKTTFEEFSNIIEKRSNFEEINVNNSQYVTKKNLKGLRLKGLKNNNMDFIIVTDNFLIKWLFVYNKFGYSLIQIDDRKGMKMYDIIINGDDFQITGSSKTREENKEYHKKYRENF